jgi:hypothetical protein
MMGSLVYKEKGPVSLDAFYKPPGPLILLNAGFLPSSLQIPSNPLGSTNEEHLTLSFDRLSPETQRILDEPNAGGQSIRSEALAMEFLSQVKHAKDIFTEMEIDYYYSNWKKCDFITTISDENVGVSVTRILPRINLDALGVRFKKEIKPHDELLYLEEEDYVSQLLYKKLAGLVISRAGTLEKCAFSRSILFVWSPCRRLTELLQATFHYCTDELLKEDIELIVVESTDFILRSDFHNNINTNIIIPPQLVK